MDSPNFLARHQQTLTCLLAGGLAGLLLLLLSGQVPSASAATDTLYATPAMTKVATPVRRNLSSAATKTPKKFYPSATPVAPARTVLPTPILPWTGLLSGQTPSKMLAPVRGLAAAPTLVWPAPLTGLPASKLGFHAAICADPDFMEFVRRIHPRVITAPDDRECLVWVKTVSPQTVTIGRSMQAGKEEHWSGTADPVAAAQKYVEKSLKDYQRYPSIDYWEGWNEYNPMTEEQWHWYAQFEGARACAMQAQGLRAAVGGFGVGWPNTYEQMQWFLPALEAAYRCGGIFTLHEYNSPTFQCGVDINKPGIITGAPALSVPAGWHTLRYRFIYEGLLKPQGLGDLPLAITELGIVGGPAGGACNDPGYNGASWKSYQRWWIQQGLGPTGPQAYVNLLAWYDAELQKDPYVIGASIFTVGTDQIWGGFDSHDFYRPLAYYEAGQQ